MTDTYDDGTIVCGPDRLEIHSYYFPFGTKSVPYTQIKGLQRIEIKGVWSGTWTSEAKSVPSSPPKSPTRSSPCSATEQTSTRATPVG
jgi:hypothetical protein